MSKSKNISYFRISFILLINIICTNIFIFTISLIYLILINKKDVLIYLILCFLLLFNTTVLKDFINIGFVVKKNDHIIIVDSLIYKTMVSTSDYELGDFVQLKEHGSRLNEDKYVKYNILFENEGDIKLISHNTLLSYSFRHLNKLDENIQNVCNKVLFNNYVSDDDLDIYLGFGFCFYYLLKIVFNKNKYLSIVLMMVYSLFFTFQIKFILIIIDFILSYFETRNIDNLSIKIIIILIINHRLLLNYSILISIIYGLLNCFDLDIKIFSSIIQSILFGSINIFISFLYKYFVYIQILLFSISLCLFIFPKFEFIYFLLKILSKIMKLISFNIRGQVSVISLIIIIIFYKFHKNRIIIHLVLLICLSSPINNPLKHLTFIDVGQGDATLIKGSFGSYNVLIDTGSSYNYSKLKRQLFNEGIYTIDYLIISHNDSDHNGNIENLNNDFKIRKIIDYPIDINLNDLYLKNIYLDKFDNDNDNSLIYLANINNYNILFTGDISSEIEDLLIKSNKIDSIDILKVAHHGSKFSSSNYFLRKTLPKIAIISTNGQYGHPSKEVIERLNKYKIDTYITKNDGSVIIYFTNLIDFIKTSNYDFGIIIS